MSRGTLLIGPDGMLGAAFERLFAARDLNFLGLRYPDFDITSRELVDRAIAGDVGVVINCSGWTDVDGAESHEAEAFAVNAEGVGLLARRCREIDALLLHFSTDYVFDGRATTPYPVDARRAPVGVYGRSKARGEELIEASGCAHLIVRTSWLYAPWGKNFVRTMVELSRSREVLRVVDDQRGRPTCAMHLASTALELLDAGARGIYHVTDGGEATWYDLARETLLRSGSACRVEPCATAEFPRPAPRPTYSVLDLSRTEALLGRVMPDWRACVAEVVSLLSQERGDRS